MSDPVWEVAAAGIARTLVADMVFQKVKVAVPKELLQELLFEGP
jgi:hypothetical protein